MKESLSIVLSAYFQKQKLFRLFTDLNSNIDSSILVFKGEIVEKVKDEIIPFGLCLTGVGAIGVNALIEGANDGP